MRISIIAAMDEKRGIGKDNDLLFKIPEDLKRFREITKGRAVIMGRKTWESLPVKPLPNRTNIIVTRNLSFSFAGGGLAKLAGSLEEAIEIAKCHHGESRSVRTTPESDSGQARMTEKEPEIFVIGGGQIYKQALPLADKLYLTIVEGDFDADTFFPDYSQFKKVVFEKKGESNGYKYRFLELERV